MKRDAISNQAAESRDSRDQIDLMSLVRALCASDAENMYERTRCPGRRPLPTPEVVREIVESLRSVLFPRYFGKTDLTSETMLFHIGGILNSVRHELCEQILRGLCFACTRENVEDYRACQARAEDITREFLNRLPETRRMLATDVEAAYIGDPAATSPDEAIFCYPGLLAITNYRLAHDLYLLGVPLIPRIITEHAHSATGIDIHPGASIEESFFIDHGTGVVIGETSVIGARVRLYQGVTLGAKSFPLDKNGAPIKGVKRHPNVEEDVIIYSEATILGPVTIGRGAVIGGNVWLTHDVSPGSRITQAQSRENLYESGGGI